MAMCQLLLSGVGYVPTPNVHLDVWDRVESYTIYMLLACRLKITFTFSLEIIITFLVQPQHLLLPSLIITFFQVRVGTPLSLLLCCISSLGPEGLLQVGKNIKCSLPATNPQNTSRVNLFHLPSKEMTLMRMVLMVAIRPIWLLW